MVVDLQSDDGLTHEVWQTFDHHGPSSVRGTRSFLVTRYARTVMSTSGRRVFGRLLNIALYVAT